MMTVRRVVNISPPNYSPRSSLQDAHHSIVDSVLKDLKQCTRRLQAAFASQQVDLIVLEKLYYKGNNQHRTALFWRRVSDIRKCGRRLEGVDVCGLVETVRLSFWGSDVQQNPKLSKGPWTHYPDTKTVRMIAQRLNDCRSLVRNMQERLTKAHNHFNLEFQTGAFLQLILTLTAISSRVAILLTEIESAVELGCEAVYRFLLVLDPAQASNIPHWAKRGLSCTRRATPSASARDPGVRKLALDFDVGEDLGMVMPTAPVVEAQTPSPTLARDAKESIKEDERLSVQTSDFMFVSTKSRIAPTTIARATVRTDKTIVTSTATTDGKRKSSKAKDVAVRERPVKKKKKKDEIDDIFGF